MIALENTLKRHYKEDDNLAKSILRIDNHHKLLCHQNLRNPIPKSCPTRPEPTICEPPGMYVDAAQEEI